MNSDERIDARFLCEASIVLADDHCFRTLPVFETVAEHHGWLNEIVAVGFGRRTRGGVTYRIMQVE
jgi:hypothetical protein